jgi:hypothetical protein
MAQPFDLVLHLQFTSFEFHDSQIIDRGMGQAFGDFIFERLMFLFQFRKVRLHRHAVCLLNQWLSPRFKCSADSTQERRYTRLRAAANRRKPFDWRRFSASLNALVENAIIAALLPRRTAKAQAKPTVAMTDEEERALRSSWRACCRNTATSTPQFRRWLPHRVPTLSRYSGSRNESWSRDKIRRIEDQLTPNTIA